MFTQSRSFMTEGLLMMPTSDNTFAPTFLAALSQQQVSCVCILQVCACVYACVRECMPVRDAAQHVHMSTYTPTQSLDSSTQHQNVDLILPPHRSFAISSVL